jgi:hypothetical protein
VVGSDFEARLFVDLIQEMTRARSATSN